MKKLLLFIVVAAVQLAGCTSLAVDCYPDKRCTNDAAFAAGINDANNVKPMVPDYAIGCPYHHNKLDRAYRRGYDYAFAYEQEPPHCTYHSGGPFCSQYRRNPLEAARCALEPGICLTEVVVRSSCTAGR